LTCHSLGNSKTSNVVRRGIYFFPEASRSIEVSTVFDAAASARYNPGGSLLSESEKVITTRPINTIVEEKRRFQPQLWIKAAKICRIGILVGRFYPNFRFWEAILEKLFIDLA